MSNLIFVFSFFHYLLQFFTCNLLQLLQMHFLKTFGQQRSLKLSKFHYLKQIISRLSIVSYQIQLMQLDHVSFNKHLMLQHGCN